MLIVLLVIFVTRVHYEQVNLRFGQTYYPKKLCEDFNDIFTDEF